MNNYSDLRFGFGRNWKDFAKTLEEQQIEAAMGSLRSSLDLQDLSGLRFLDAGCGSGLFSLAACRLGAHKVVAFDYDWDSVSCAIDLNNRFGPYPNWTITQGDLLDQAFLNTLGTFDVVYSWGVLHHTGNMWKAIDNVCTLITPRGLLFISIYNDQGPISRVWCSIKRTYVRSPQIVKLSMASIWYVAIVTLRMFMGIWHRKPPRIWFQVSDRGMTLWHDVVDWVGGYPFETASMVDLKAFFAARGFTLANIRVTTGSGCNEFIIRRTKDKA